MMSRQKINELISQLKEQLCEGSVSFAHFRLGKGFATVVVNELPGVFENGDTAAPDKALLYSISFCSPQDQFNRATGRLKSFRKLIASDYATMFYPSDKFLRPFELAQMCLEEHLATQRDQIPNWAKKGSPEPVTRKTRKPKVEVITEEVQEAV